MVGSWVDLDGWTGNKVGNQLFFQSLSKFLPRKSEPTSFRNSARLYQTHGQSSLFEFTQHYPIQLRSQYPFITRPYSLRKARMRKSQTGSSHLCAHSVTPIYLKEVQGIDASWTTVCVCVCHQFSPTGVCLSITTQHPLTLHQSCLLTQLYSLTRVYTHTSPSFPPFTKPINH